MPDFMPDLMPDLASRGPGGLNLLTATQAAARLRDGSATSVELVEHCLARIAARESQVHAWAFVDRDIALAQARARDNEAPRGPLHGVPVGIKDIFDTYDMPTAYGSPIYKGHRPVSDTAVVSLLRLAGAVILGKCATTGVRQPGSDRDPQSTRSVALARSFVQRQRGGGGGLHGAPRHRLADRRIDDLAGGVLRGGWFQVEPYWHRSWRHSASAPDH